MIRAGYGTGHFLHIKEVVTWVDSLVMVAYELGIFPLIQEFRKAQPGITQTWYADDTGVGGNFGGIHRHIDNLMV